MNRKTLQKIIKPTPLWTCTASTVSATDFNQTLNKTEDFELFILYSRFSYLLPFLRYYSFSFMPVLFLFTLFLTHTHTHTLLCLCHTQPMPWGAHFMTNQKDTGSGFRQHSPQLTLTEITEKIILWHVSGAKAGTKSRRHHTAWKKTGWIFLQEHSRGETLIINLNNRTDRLFYLWFYNYYISSDGKSMYHFVFYKII